MPPLNDILNLVQAGGTITVLVLLIYGLITERLVPRGRLDDERAQKKDALDLARSALASMDQQSKAMEQLSDAVRARNELEVRRLDIEARK